MENKTKYFIVINKLLKEEKEKLLADHIAYLAKVDFIIDPDGIYKNPCSITLRLYEVDGSNLTRNKIDKVSFITLNNIKWDGCSHWNFFGEDEDKSSYYHLCGEEDFLRFIYGMVLSVSIAKKVMVDTFDEDFFGDEYLTLEEMCNTRYDIKEVSLKQIDFYCDNCNPFK